MGSRGHLRPHRARRTCCSRLLRPKRIFFPPPPRPKTPLPPPTPTTHCWKICMPSASMGRSGETWGGGEAVGRIQPPGSSLAGRRTSLFRRQPRTEAISPHRPSSPSSPLSHSTLSQARLPDLSSSPTSGWDSPLGTTPIKGSRLTMSRLASPVGSFSTPVGSPSFPFISQSPPSPTLLDWNKAQLTSPPRGFSSLPEPSLRAVPPLSWPTS